MQFFDTLLTLFAVVLAGWYLWRTLIVRKGCAGCSSGCGSQCSGQGTSGSWLKPADCPAITGMKSEGKNRPHEPGN